MRIQHNHRGEEGCAPHHTERGDRSHEARFPTEELVVPRGILGGASFSASTAVARATGPEDLEKAVRTVHQSRYNWFKTTPSQRELILQEVKNDIAEVAEKWISAALTAKRIRPGTSAEAEEWLAGPVATVSYARNLAETLREIKERGAPRVPGAVSTLPNGQVSATIFPANIFHRLLFTGFTGRVVMEPGVTEENLSRNMAGVYQRRRDLPKVALVLGAGNVSSIAPTDVLHKLFVENEVVVLKVNPVNDYLGEFLEAGLRSLIRRGVVRIVYGGGDVGEALCKHPSIDTIHITGSDKTHDAVVFGSGAEGQKRKARGEKLLSKPITSELGNISPVIIFPGPWSKSDIHFQAQNIVTSIVNNAGYNCNATRLIVTPKGWEKRSELLEAVKRELQKIPPRNAYYPGAVDRFRAFAAAHPEAERCGIAREGELPWMFIGDLDPKNHGEICFSHESFCSVVGEVPLPFTDLKQYADEAVSFVNSRVWGSLNASIIVHPRSAARREVRALIDDVTIKLKFGTVGVNHWAAVSYALVTPPWGAFPGNSETDIGSGSGFVHNSYMFDRPQKTIFEGPFRVFPKPAWFASNRTSAELAKKLLEFEREPRLSKLPGPVWSAMRG